MMRFAGSSGKCKVALRSLCVLLSLGAVATTLEKGLQVNGVAKTTTNETRTSCSDYSDATDAKCQRSSYSGDSGDLDYVADESSSSNSQYDGYYYYEDYDATNRSRYDAPNDHTVGDYALTDKTIVVADAAMMDASEKRFSLAEAESSILIGEAIVSVVTTKSVVNGTISIAASTSAPSVTSTEQMDAPPIERTAGQEDFSGATTEDFSGATTEDNGRVLASVQTSRSISGARFLPFPVVDRIEEIEHETKAETSLSTESIIDKLDRVQSELSGGFLAAGFRNAANTLQLNVLPEMGNRSTKPPSTASHAATPGKLVPRRYSDKRLNRTDHSPKFAFKWPTAKNQSGAPASNKVALLRPDISAFLPAGYKLKRNEAEATESTVLRDILAKSKVNVSHLLPADYETRKREQHSSTVETPSSRRSHVDKKKSDDSGVVPQSISIQSLIASSNFDVSALLPRDYVQKTGNTGKVFSSSVMAAASAANNTNNSSTSTDSTRKSAADSPKIVFPSRPGGRKISHRITTTASPRSETPAAVIPRIQKGWPTRATTEFTGWPTPSTTAISIEKLLEAARTANRTSTDTTSVPTTSASSIAWTRISSSSSTTPTSTTVGICEEECEIAGTIRLIGNASWLPELLDRNTREWQELANELEREINLVFSSSSILSRWYRRIRIDSFSPGSILVDFFVELTKLPRKIDTQELKGIFHDCLKERSSSGSNDSAPYESVKVGAFTIDPKNTDFIVIPKISTPNSIEDDDILIPQWAIAVIVIGLGGLLFIIIFGVSVLANHESVSKLKPSVSTIYEEDMAKNIFGSTHMTALSRPCSTSAKQSHTIWTDPDISWNDKSFESTSNKILVDNKQFQDGKKYNLHDSWRSEWNGYHPNPSYTPNKYSSSDSNVNLSNHRQYDYDTNF